MTRFLIITVLLGFSLQGNSQTNVRFSHEWRFEGHVAPFLVPLDKGYYTAEGLNVTVDPGTGSPDVINRVATRAYDMGLADINSVVRYRDNPANARLMAVMMVYDAAPFSLLTLKKNNVRKPKDLEGKTLGAPAGDATWTNFPILAKLNNIDIAKIKVENVGFPIREPMLAQGKVDAVTAFVSNATGVVAQGVPESEVDVLMYSAFGVDLYGSAVIVNPDFLKAQPKAVAGFVRALIKGFQDSARDPEGAIESVMKRNPVAKRDLEVYRLKKVNELVFVTDDVKRNGFGAVDMKRLERAIDQLGIAFNYTNKPRAADIFTAEFLPPREQRLPK
jgi:NitT/TauT family transport system substrate-binding protein